MNDNIFEFPGQAPSAPAPNRVKPERNTVTIVMNGIGFATSGVSNALDMEMAQRMRAAHMKWVREGRPVSRQGIYPPTDPTPAA